MTRRARHVLRLVVETMAFGVSTRRWSLIFVIALGLAFTALVLASQVVAPIAVYPFI